jgi:glycosyltransferase involved in cell wall biosynthesis
VPLQSELPVVLCPGLIRPYKGIDLLLEAWREQRGAELWIAGRPMMDVSSLIARAPTGTRFLTRYLTDGELVALLRRADLVVLPYREIDQSGMLFAALALGVPLLLSDAGGFPEVAATGAAVTFPSGDSAALGRRLRELLDDPDRLGRMREAAARAPSGPYSWSAIAQRTLDLYAEISRSRSP